jgi:hypothetical protein
MWADQKTRITGHLAVVAAVLVAKVEPTGRLDAALTWFFAAVAVVAICGGMLLYVLVRVFSVACE